MTTPRRPGKGPGDRPGMDQVVGEAASTLPAGTPPAPDPDLVHALIAAVAAGLVSHTEARTWLGLDSSTTTERTNG